MQQFVFEGTCNVMYGCTVLNNQPLNIFLILFQSIKLPNIYDNLKDRVLFFEGGCRCMDRTEQIIGSGLFNNPLKQVPVADP